MSKLLKELTQFFTPKTQNSLEQFITSKRPTSTAEAEYWARYFERKGL